MKNFIVFLALWTCSLTFVGAQNKYFAVSRNKAPILYIQSSNPSQAPLREMRAVWLTTIGGLDWPHSYSQSAWSAKKQQQELCNILDEYVKAGFNTVLIQTRVRATTIFPSSMEPWDGCLSGHPGQSPGYDALQFAIDECHKRGLKLHAWVVTIPIGRWNGAGVTNLRKTRPELVKKIGDEVFMNPEHPGTATYLADFCRDIVERYDVDGIHLDYIRYPETWGKIPDKNKGRENITRIVRAVNNVVKSRKPWVMMSCSPIGKYADTKRMWSHGWNARDIVCQDAAQWLKDDLMDALIPMMYFRDENFYPFAIDWKERSAGKIIVPGLGIYFMHPREKNWPLTDITREMHVQRQYGMGVCMFRSKFFTDNTKGIYDYTHRIFSPQPALQPVMTWYRQSVPQKPAALHLGGYSETELLLSWDDSPSRSQQGKDGGILYNVYGSATYPVDTHDADNLLASDYQRTAIPVPARGSVRYFAVTAVNRYGMESAPVQLSGVAGTTPADGVAALQPVPQGMVPCDGKRLSLKGYDVEEGNLVTVNSNVGNAVGSSIVSKDREGLYVDVSRYPSGHYTLRLLNRKNYSHLVGRFVIMRQ